MKRDVIGELKALSAVPNLNSPLRSWVAQGWYTSLTYKEQEEVCDYINRMLETLMKFLRNFKDVFEEYARLEEETE